MSFVGGALKLKGGQALPVKGGVKKKKKSKKGKELAVVATEDGGSEQPKGEAGEDATKVTPEGVVLDPSQAEDRRTEAEKKFEEHTAKYEEARAKKAAGKSHRERVKELNEKLAAMTEHYDLFRVSYTA